MASYATYRCKDLSYKCPEQGDSMGDGVVLWSGYFVGGYMSELEQLKMVAPSASGTPSMCTQATR